MLKNPQRRTVWILIAVLFLCSAVMSEVLKPQHDQYLLAGRAVTPGSVREEEISKSVVKDTPFQALLPTLFGVREVMASLMWVRADDYFHRGEYRPIISMIRQIVAIDPHQLDVYATGAWHMAYNFMDKRLIQNGVEFLEEGSRNNNAVYDLFFELGYMHYDKTKNYPASIQAYSDAAQRGTTTGKVIPPAYVRHQLAHAKEKAGDIDACIQQWEENLEIARKEIQEGEKQAVAGPNIDAARHNLYITERRKNERVAAIAEREGNRAEALKNWQANVVLAQEWLKEYPTYTNVVNDLNVAQGHVERLQAGKLNPAAPTNVDLKFTVTRLGPRKILVEGTANVLDLSRVNVRFQDKDYDERIKQGFDFKMNNCSLEWDNVSVNQGKFKHTFDFNKDPADMDRPGSEIYPLNADQYVLRVTYNPRFQAAFIQDRYGWNGEGLTAPPDQLKIDPTRAGKMNGKTYPLRYAAKEVLLTKDDLMGKDKKVLYSSGS